MKNTNLDSEKRKRIPPRTSAGDQFFEMFHVNTSQFLFLYPRSSSLYTFVVLRCKRAMQGKDMSQSIGRCHIVRGLKFKITVRGLGDGIPRKGGLLTLR